MTLFLGTLTIKLQKHVPSLEKVCSSLAPWISWPFLHTLPVSVEGYWTHTSESPLAFLNLGFRTCLVNWMICIPCSVGSNAWNAGKRGSSGASLVWAVDVIQLQVASCSSGKSSAKSNLQPRIWDPGFSCTSLKDVCQGLTLVSTLLCMKPLATAYNSLWGFFCFVFLQVWAQLSLGPCLGLLGATVVQLINTVKDSIKQLSALDFHNLWPWEGFWFCPSLFNLHFFYVYTNQQLNLLQHDKVANISRHTISDYVQLYSGCLWFKFSELSKSDSILFTWSKQTVLP